MTELTFSLQPKQRKFLETIEENPITFYGGAKGGGKSYAARTIILLRRFKYPGTHGGLFRRTYKELEGNHIRPLFKTYPILKQYWNESKKLLSLPNGSTLEFCHCENERDVDLYQGREFEDLFIEEAGQWTESMFGTLLGSNRSSLPGFRPRCALTGNPGGIGHQWLKRLFVEKRYKPDESPEDYAFIQALVDDNAALIENDPGYIKKLKAEPNQALRRAFLYGDWDIFAGQFFSEIRREVHLVKPFPIPPHWNKFGAYDFGFNHPAAFGWFAVDEDGNVFMYREFIKAQMRVDQFVAEIKKHKDTKDLYPVVAGHDCWAKVTNKINTHQGENPPKIAEQFSKFDPDNPNDYPIILKRAIVDRVQGASQIRDYLAWNGKSGNKPRIYIFDTCPVTFDCLTRMIFDPDHVEDVLKVDAVDGDVMTGDDPYDMFRYGLMTRPALSEAPKPSPQWGTKEYADLQVVKMEKEAQEYFERLEQAEKGFGTL